MKRLGKARPAPTTEPPAVEETNVVQADRAAVPSHCPGCGRTKLLDLTPAGIAAMLARADADARADDRQAAIEAAAYANRRYLQNPHWGGLSTPREQNHLSGP